MPGRSSSAELVVRAMTAAGVLAEVPVGGSGEPLAATAELSPLDGADGWSIELVLTATASEPLDAGIVVALPLGPTDDPRWLIPGLFYGENRPETCRVPYPRWAPGPSHGDAFTADAWSFRADRAATPLVMGWGRDGSLAVATAEVSPLGLAGVGFAGGPAPELRLAFPYREEPVVYDGSDHPRPAETPLHRWTPGESVRLVFRVYRADTDPHGYAPILRDAHAWLSAGSEPRPWVSIAEAARLAAEGLHRWHYRETDAAIYETVAFERAGDGSAVEHGDRPAMHVAWLSGAPCAFALLEHGRRVGDEPSIDAGIRVLDAIATNLAPCGTFWGQWTAADGWTKGWTPGRDRLHARTLAEATLFTARALRNERERGVEHAAWRHAVASNLGFVVARQRDDGAFPGAWDGQTGRVESWEGGAALGWIPALVEGAGLLGDPSLAAAAARAGRFYRRFVDAEFINGAPEDVDLAPSSEDGYQAVMAYVALADCEADGARAEWLDLARRAADWTLTFRYAYDVAFTPETLLGAYRFSSLGADQASVANQHLHAYGLVCLPEMVRLARQLDDPWFLVRTRENLACFRQFIASADGDFNARRGMAPERYYQTNCFGPKGAIGMLSHAWCLGLLLYACEAALTIPELQADRDDRA